MTISLPKRKPGESHLDAIKRELQENPLPELPVVKKQETAATTTPKTQKKPKEPKQTTEYRSELFLDGIHYEQGYDPITKSTYFIGYHNDPNFPSISKKSFLQDGDKIIRPIEDDLLKKSFIILPEKTEGYGTVAQLDTEMKEYINTWMEVNENHLEILPGYIRLTWIADKLNTIPYLRAIAEFGQGKTRYLDTIGGICRKPMFCGGAVTVAPIFRIMDKWKGTLILDEFNLDENSEDTRAILQILNQGFQRDKGVFRCNQDYDVDAFDPYGPKIIASKKFYKDYGFESRCITEIIQPSSDKPVQLPKAFYEKRHELQNKLLLYRFHVVDTISVEKLNAINYGSLQPRIRQTYSSLLLAYPDDNPMQTKIMLMMQERSNEMMAENTETLSGMIFNTFLLLEVTGHPDMTPKDIFDRFKGQHFGQYETLTVNVVGKILKQLGFTVTPTNIDGRTKRLVTLSENNREKLLQRYNVEDNHLEKRIYDIVQTSFKPNKKPDEEQ